MAGGGPVFAAAAVAVAAALPLLAVAGGLYSDCFDTCFKNCIANDKSMADYCKYACDLTCGPDDELQRHLAALAGLPINCQLACVRASCTGLNEDGKDDMEVCYGDCYDSCKAKANRPRPLRAGTGAVRPVALPDHPFHKIQDALQPSAKPDQDGIGHPA